MTQTLPMGGGVGNTVSQATDENVSGHTTGKLGSGSGLSSPRGATSVRPTRKQGWIDEQHRRDRLSPVRARWEHRASELNAAIGAIASERPFAPELVQMKRCRAYAVARVARLTADIAPRLDWCGSEFLPVACACGYVGASKTCRQWWLCSSCREQRAPTLGADIRRGLDRALTAAVTRWGMNGGRGMRPKIVLITLTQKHSGNVSADQQALADGWRKLYKRMHEDYGAFPYAGVWEVTRGKDGLGHVHMHVAAVWTYRDWGRIREQWVRACPSSQYITFVADRRDGKPSTPASVAKYLGKYLSKGADVGGFDPRLRAEVSAAFYNQRSVISSAYFFRREVKCCRKCNERYRLVEMEKLTRLDMLPAALTLHVCFHGIAPPS